MTPMDPNDSEIKRLCEMGADVERTLRPIIEEQSPPTTRREILDGVMLEASPDAFELHDAAIFELNRENRDLRERLQQSLLVRDQMYDINKRYHILCERQSARLEFLERESLLGRLIKWIRAK